MSKLPRVAWFSDMRCLPEGSASLSAYVSRLLLPLLSEEFEVEVFARERSLCDGITADHFLNAFRRHREDPFDIFFYQFEDTPAAGFVRAHLGLMPGIVWFHDFFLTSDGPEPLLNSPWEEIVAKFNDPGRVWPDRGVEYTRPGPQAYREAGLSLVPIFSSERDHDEYRRVISHRFRSRGLRSWYLPVPVDKVGPSAYAGKLSHQILFCGSARIEHRAAKILQGISESRSRWKVVWVINEEEREQAEILLQESGCSAYELVSPRTPEKWSERLNDAQIAVLSHFSVYGHMNPYLPMALAAGLPCIVTDFCAGHLLPDSTVLKIQPGETEAGEVTMFLNRLEQKGGAGSVDAAASFALEFHDVESVASELALIFRESAPRLREAINEWKSIEADARASLCEEALSGSEILKSTFSELGWGE